MKYTFTDQQIFDSINNQKPLAVIGYSQEVIEDKLRDLESAIYCLPPVFAINYKELQEKDPKKFKKLYDLKQRRSTLEGFIEELKILSSNNQAGYIEAQRKLIKGSAQYRSYVDALQQIAETTVERRNHRYAKTYNYAKSHAFVLVDDQIEFVSDLLSTTIGSAIEVQTEKILDNPYCNDYTNYNQDVLRGFGED